MAVQLAHSLTGLNFLSRTTGLVQGSAGSYSCCFWYRPDQTVTAGNYATPYIYRNTAYTRDIAVFGQDTQIYTLEGFNGTLDQVSSGQTLTAGHWYPVAYHRSGTSHSFYISTKFVGDITLDMSAATFDALYLGSDDSGDESLGTFAYFREWTAVLSPAEFAAEANARAAVRTTNLVTDTSLRTNLLDATSNHNDWTGNGSFDFVADDPIPNGSSATDPIVITLPYSATVDVKPTGVEFIFDYWLKYTAVAPEVYIGGWFFGQLVAGQYRPSTTVFSDAGITHYPQDSPIGPSGTQNLRFQMPVTAGQSYWFQAVANWTTMTSDTLTVDFLTAPNESAPDGATFVNDDTRPFYAAVFSSLNGDDYHLYKFVPYANTVSETGGDFSSVDGSTVVIDDFDDTFKAYNSNIALVNSTATAPVNDAVVRRTADSSAVYVSPVASAGIVTRWTFDGVASTVHHLTGITALSALAPNPDETILYVSPFQSAGHPIKRWDLVNDVYLTDLVAGVAAKSFHDLLVLSDGTIVAMRGEVDGQHIVSYDPTGTILSNYAITPGGAGSIAFDFTDPLTYVLVRLQDHAFTGSSTIFRVKLSDGSMTSETQVAYNSGIYGAAVTATPIAKFGISQSCPFFPVRAVSGPAGDPVPTLIRRERIFRHLSDEQQWIFYQWLQIDAEAGVGLSDGQGSDPQIILQWSDDGGHTWSNEHLLSAGKQGEYGKRAILKQPLGRSRDRVFKVAMSDPVKWALLNAYFGAEKGSS